MPFSASNAPNFLTSSRDLDERHARPQIAGPPAAGAIRERVGQVVERKANEQRDGNDEHGKRGDDLELTEIVEPEDCDRNRLSPPGVKKNGRAELAQRRDEDEQERDGKPGTAEWQEDVPNRPEAGGAGDARRLLERRVDLTERCIRASRRERHETSDVGDRAKSRSFRRGRRAGG